MGDGVCYPCGLLGASGRKHLTWAKDVANLGHRAREEEMAKYGFEMNPRRGKAGVSLDWVGFLNVPGLP